MSATIAQIRAGLVVNLIDGLGDELQISPYQLDNPSPPTIQVMGLEEMLYDQAMARGLDDITIIVQAFAGTPVDRQAQTLLDTWQTGFGGTSVKAALESDRTLGGIINDLHVMRTSGDRIYNLPDRSETRGCEFYVRIFNTGT